MASTELQISTSIEGVDNLSRVNQKLGVFPIVQLTTGQKVPAGTVAAFLVNIRTYDTIIAEIKARGDDPREFEQKIAQVTDMITADVPVLVKLGMFELFSVDKWCARNSPGRHLIGNTAKELGAH